MIMFIIKKKKRKRVGISYKKRVSMGVDKKLNKWLNFFKSTYPHVCRWVVQG